MFYRPLSDWVQRPWQLIRYSLRGRLVDAALILGLSVLVTLLGMLTPQATALIVDSAIPDANGRLILELGMARVGLVFGAALLSFAQGIVGIRLAIASDVAIQSAVWDRLLNRRVSFFRRYSTGDLLDRATRVGAITHELNGAALQSMLAGLTAILNLGLLFYYSAALAMIALLVVGNEVVDAEAHEHVGRG
jgi:ABC-type bacteriocin/lantibiotic exporter with double-glycine peptidase domain